MEEEQKCKSQKKEVIRNIITIAVSIILLILIIVASKNIEIYDKPKEDETAKQGMPEVEEVYEYSTLEINDGYKIGLCGNPKNNGSEIELYITNVKENDVWIKAQILDEEEKVIGETGLIKPNQYVKTIQLEKEITNQINIKIVEYEVETYNSKGTVSLKI